MGVLEWVHGIEYCDTHSFKALVQVIKEVYVERLEGLTL